MEHRKKKSYSYYKSTNFVRIPSCVGIAPVKRLLFERFLFDLIVNDKLFWTFLFFEKKKKGKICCYREFKFVSLPNSVGIVPVNLVPLRPLLNLMLKIWSHFWFFIKWFRNVVTYCSILLDFQILLELSQLSHLLWDSCLICLIVKGYNWNQTLLMLEIFWKMIKYDITEYSNLLDSQILLELSQLSLQKKDPCLI